MKNDFKQIVWSAIALIAISITFSFLVMNDYMDKLITHQNTLQSELKASVTDSEDIRIEFSKFLKEIR